MNNRTWVEFLSGSYDLSGAIASAIEYLESPSRKWWDVHEIEIRRANQDREYSVKISYTPLFTKARKLSEAERAKMEAEMLISESRLLWAKLKPKLSRYVELRGNVLSPKAISSLDAVIGE